MIPSTATKAPTPAAAIEQLLDHLQPLSTEMVDLGSAGGRVLAQPLNADRDSPPSSVSAMDGYAVRLADLSSTMIAVRKEVGTGREPITLPAGEAVRIFTGGCIPVGTEAVIRREDVQEFEGGIKLNVDAAGIQSGENIRYQGENLRAGQEVLPVGAQINAASASAMAAFGLNRPEVFRKVRIGFLITGDELLPPGAQPRPWELRDSNGPALHGMFGHLPWLQIVQSTRAIDTLPAIITALRQLLAGCDAVFITGGVSAGDHDYVPAAIRETGCQTLFHKLPIRPGKPILAAVGPQGQAVLGCPGNPVSVLVAARRFGVPALRKLAGFAQPQLPQSVVRLTEPDGKTLNLWWYRPVRLTEAGRVELVPHMGSGDMAATARSDGFVELAPGESECERVPFWSWCVS